MSDLKLFTEEQLAEAARDWRKVECERYCNWLISGAGKYRLNHDKGFIAGARWAALKAQQVDGWIKCSERLPEIGKKVFILIRPLTPEEREYCDGTEKPWQEAGWLDRYERWIISNDRYEFDRVTHWRPQFELPELPKEGE